MRVLALTIVILAAAFRMSLAAETQAAAPAAAEEGYYVVGLEMTQEPSHDQAGMEVLMGHITHLTELYDQGVLFMAGPYDEGGHEGLSIVKAHSAEEAKGFFENDPCVLSGHMQITAVHPWWAAYSRPDNARFSPEQMMAMMNGEAPAPMTAQGAAAGSTTPAAGETAPAEDDMMEMTPGGISFIQIPASDPAASQAFYQTVFGWTMDLQEGMYFFTAQNNVMGEFTTECKPAAPQTGPTFFINTESVNAMVPKVEAAGGSVIMPPMALPQDWGHIAICADVAGNAFGLWSASE